MRAFRMSLGAVLVAWRRFGAVAPDDQTLYLQDSPILSPAIRG